MAGDNPDPIQVQITAQIDGLMTGLNNATAGVKDATAKMAGSFAPVAAASASSFDSMVGKSHTAAESMEGDFSRTEARHAAHMLGMNRAVGSFVATLPGVGMAMSMAFAPLAIMEMVMWIGKGVEKLIEWHSKAENAARELGNAEREAGTKSVLALEGLGDKLLETGIKADDLAGNHIGALNKQLKLLDHHSLNELIEAFEKFGAEADKVFSKVEADRSWWEVFTSGSKGAKSAMEDFKTAYDALLAKGDTKGADDLLKGTLDSARKILAAQKDTIALTQSHLPYEQKEAQLKADLAILDKANIGADREGLAVQQSVVNALENQVQATALINKNKAGAAANLRAEEEKKDKADKDPSSEQMTAFKQALDAQKALKENWFTWSIAREIKFWEDMAKTTGLGANAVKEIQDNIAKLTQKGAEDGEKDAEKDFERRYSAAKEGSDKRVQIAVEEFRRIAATYPAGTEQFKAAQDKMTAALNQAVAQRKAVDRAYADGKRLLALEGADTTIEAARLEQASGKISKQALLQAEKEYVREKYAITAQAEAETLALMEKGTPAYIAELNKQEAAYRKEKADEAALDKKAAADHLKNIETWRKGLTSGMESATAGIIKGTMTWGKAFQQVWGSALDFAIKQMYQMVAKHIAAEFTKTAATTSQTAVRTGVESAAQTKSLARMLTDGVRHLFTESGKTAHTVAGVTARTSIETAADVKAKVSDSAELAVHTGVEAAKTAATTVAITARLAASVAANMAEIASLAAVASAAAFASTAAIPIVGPALAPGVAAVSLAAVLAMVPLAAAEGGWERVPATTLAMLHKDEQVLPASYAEGLRKVVAGGGAGSGGGGDIHNHFNGCFDAKTFFQQHQGPMVAAMQDAIKNRRT
jgi:hypothetical protein